MTDIALTEWEHQPHVLDVLTSREIGAWLERRDKRRDSRILQEIRQEIEQERWCDKDTRISKNANSSGIEVALAIIDKHIKEIEK